MNPIALIPTVLSNNLAVAVVGICVLFFVALLVSRAWSAPRHEEISNGISWRNGKLTERRQRVK